MKTYQSSIAGLPVDRRHIRRNLYWRSPRKVPRLEMTLCK